MKSVELCRLKARQKMSKEKPFPDLFVPRVGKIGMCQLLDWPGFCGSIWFKSAERLGMQQDFIKCKVSDASPAQPVLFPYLVTERWWIQHLIYERLKWSDSAYTPIDSEHFSPCFVRMFWQPLAQWYQMMVSFWHPLGCPLLAQRHGLSGERLAPWPRGAQVELFVSWI